MNHLDNNKTTLSPKKLQKQLHKLDNERTKAEKVSNSKGRKVKMRQVPYFLGLATKANNVIFLKDLKGKEIMDLIQIINTSQDWLKSRNIMATLPKKLLSLETINKIITKSKLECMELKKNRHGNINSYF